MTNGHTSPPLSAVELLQRAKELAQQYYALTGRPLGITGEVAECEAARLLGLELAEVRQAGYDALRREGQAVVKLQIKGRCLSKGAAGRLGRIDLSKEWDAVLLVLLDGNLETYEIWEADRAAVTVALRRPGSAARNKRGALGIAQFKRIGTLVWTRDAQRGALGSRESLLTSGAVGGRARQS